MKIFVSDNNFQWIYVKELLTACMADNSEQMQCSALVKIHNAGVIYYYDNSMCI